MDKKVTKFSPNPGDIFKIYYNTSNINYYVFSYFIKEGKSIYILINIGTGGFFDFAEDYMTLIGQIQKSIDNNLIEVYYLGTGLKILKELK